MKKRVGEKGREAGGAKSLVLWGTYDLTKPRVRIMRDSLRRIDGDLIEIHADIWSGTRDKSAVSGVSGGMGVALRYLSAYPGLIWRYLRAPEHSVVAVGYMGHLDVLVLWPFARMRRVTVAWDMFLSLYDTVVLDRRILRKGGIGSGFLWTLERMAIGAADKVVLDTQTHARRVEDLFGLESGRLLSVPVGAEEEIFPKLPPRARRAGEPLRILFYGQFIPLHGIDTILAAARLAAGRNWRWHLIGTGQEAGRIRKALAADPVEKLDWEEWVPYEELIERMRDADICLGIFGDSGKAASVIPNKVYQALSAGRPIVTRDSPAMRELVPEDVPGIALIPPADPQALVDAIERIDKDEMFRADFDQHIRQSMSIHLLAECWNNALDIK